MLTSYQAKCATVPAGSAAQRCRQWQIMGGNFGSDGGYEVLLPEEREDDPTVIKPANEEDEFDDDVLSFFDHILQLHVQANQQSGRSISSPICYFSLETCN